MAHKALETFAIPELLEKILLEIEDLRDIVACKRVCHAFHAAIASSIKFSWLPSFPLQDHGLPTKYLPRPDPLIGDPGYAHTNCINPLLASPSRLPLAINVSTPGAQYWYIKQYQMAVVPTLKAVCMIVVRKGLPGKRKPLVCDRRTLGMRLAHPFVEVRVEVSGSDEWTVKAVVKPATTLGEFVEWCEMELEEKMESGFVQELEVVQ